MTKYTSRLCIGGPLDGKRVETRDGPGFASPELGELEGGSDLDTPTTVSRVFYRKETFNTPQGNVAFWAQKKPGAFRSRASTFPAPEFIRKAMPSVACKSAAT